MGKIYYSVQKWRENIYSFCMKEETSLGQEDGRRKLLKMKTETTAIKELQKVDNIVGH